MSNKVTAMRAGVTKPFSARSWALMPRDKYGWIPVVENPTPPAFVSAEIEARAATVESENVQHSPAPKKGRKPKKDGVPIDK